ncbi:hypothetical protein GCM10009754_36150 [Amycolatopsis minnesotensis]|uniref:Phage tail tape measure protein domain-containing protein n=2 Tax=Amycolatopsis minnesotensis TaxID=337894 RepID=A0ABN2R1E3_9PSEU
MVNSGEVVWIDTLPSARGWGAELAKQAAGAGTRAGQQIGKELERSAGDAGRRAGTSLGTGIEAAKENVKRVAAELETARNREADAAGKVRVAEARLDEIRASGNAKASQLAAAEERLATTQRGLTTAQERTASTSGRYEQAQRNAAEATDEVTVSLDKADRRSSGFGSSLVETTRQAGTFAFGLAAIGNAASVAMDTLENARLGDKLAAQLGAPADMAADLGRVAGNLYAQAYGDSLGQVNEAIRGVMQSGLVMEDATNDQIQGITGKVLNLATVFDQDLGGTTQAVGQLMKTGLARDANEALDVLTRGFQQGADRSQDLLDTMTEYSVQFQKFGLDASMATGLLVQGMRAGARNSDLVADAIKEFSIRAVDGSKLTAQGFQAVGLNAGEMAAKIARGGPEATGALDLVLDRLRAMPDPVARSQAAVALFGTQAEDLGQALYALDPSKAVQALGNVAGAADRMGATLNDNAGARLVAFQRAIQTGLVDFFGGVVLPALQSAVQWVRDNADWLVPLAIALGGFATGYAAVAAATKLYELATKGAAAAQWLLNAAMRANPLGLIVGAISGVVAAFTYFWQTSAPFRDFWIGLWHAIEPITPELGLVAAALGAGVLAVNGYSLAARGMLLVQSLWQSGSIAARVAMAAWNGAVWLGTAAVQAYNAAKWAVVAVIGVFNSALAFARSGMILATLAQAGQTAAQWASNAAHWAVIAAMGVYNGLMLVVRGAIVAWTGVQWALNAAMAANPITLVVVAIGALVAAFVWLWNSSAGFRDFWISIWDKITGAISWAWEKIIKPVLDWFGNRIDDIKFGFENMGAVTENIFNKIVNFIKKPIQVVIDVIWNNGLRKVYNAAADLIPGMDELPELKLARGGVIPGYAPGKDTVPALLSPGEAVLVPELVRAIGPSTILAANAAAMSGRGFSRGGLVGRFADGGIVGTPAGPGAAAATTAATPDPSASTVATEALTVASAALADTVNTVLVPALVILEQHTGVLLPAAHTQLGVSLAALQLNTMTVWTAITGHIGVSANTITARQWQLQADLAASWAFVAGSVWASVNSQNGALGALGNGLAALRAAVAFTAGWVRDRFAEMQGYAGNPVRWILQWPLNAGLVAAWNKLNADFSLNHAVAPVVIPFASGGPVPGAGNTDKVPALLTPGEYVLPKRVVQTWGVGNIRAAHLAALGGSFPGLEGLLGADIQRAQVVPGYQSGGLVTDTGSAMDAAIGRVVAFGRSMQGRPYVWGGSSTAGTDCSGWQAMLKRAALDQQPYARREWATASVNPGSPPPGFVDGINGTFAIGVSHGHTAGTVAGINAESGGAHGYVAFGPPSTGADDSQFPMKFHIAELGGQFVSGGGGFDPAALVDSALADTYRMVEDATRFFPGNIAARHGQGITRQAVDGAKRYAIGKLSELYASTAGAAGSPEVVAAVRAVATRYGWGSGPQWDALSWLISHESGWNPGAKNPHSSARGLFQQMESVHGAVAPNAAGQAEWGLGYIASRYRDPLGAKGFWEGHHWYDQGGWLQPGFTPVYNGTGKPELVLPHDTAQSVIGALHGDSEPVRLVGELSISGDGLTAFVDGRIDRSDHATGTAIARGVRI